MQNQPESISKELISVKKTDIFHVIEHSCKKYLYFCIEFFMVLDFKVNTMDWLS